MSVLLKRRLLTVTEYYQMAEVGILTPEDRVELIRGEIIEMSPIGKFHAYYVDQLNRMLTRLVGENAVVRVQNPVSLGPYSEPEPDLALLKEPMSQYRDHHPRSKDVLLLIEVADSTLEKDRKVKLPLYAEHQIPVVWIVNVATETVEVYRDPKSGEYQTQQFLDKPDTLEVPGFSSLPVASVFA